MTTVKSAHDPSEHPTFRGKDEPLSLAERATFGHDAQRCSETGRVFEQGAGAHPRHIQTAMFKVQAAAAERKAALEQEALRQAEATAAAEQKGAPKEAVALLRLVRA
jgi:hypothetical protein